MKYPSLKKLEIIEKFMMILLSFFACYRVVEFQTQEKVPKLFEKVRKKSSNSQIWPSKACICFVKLDIMDMYVHVQTFFLNSLFVYLLYMLGVSW
jgi:hypothetical protein